MPKSYGKSELAMLYFPDSNPHVALNLLRGGDRFLEKNKWYFYVLFEK